MTTATHRIAVTAFGAPSLPGGALSWAWRRMQQALCSLHGHDSLLQFEHNRMFLRCTSCGYETPGWEVARPATVLNYEDPNAETLTPARELFTERRIA